MTAAELKARYTQEDADRLDADARAVYATAPGRRLLMHLISIAGVYRSTSVSATMEQLAMAAGAREIGIKLIYLCNHACPQSILLATQERLDEQTARNAAIRDAELKQKENRHV